MNKTMKKIDITSLRFLMGLFVIMISVSLAGCLGGDDEELDSDSSGMYVFDSENVNLGGIMGAGTGF